MLSFEWLIDPVPPQVFLADYFEKQPLLIEGGDPAKFSRLLSLAAIDRFLAGSTTYHPEMFLVDAVRDLNAADYTLPDGSGRIDLPRAYQLFNTGASISISQLHDRMPELAALCRAVERTFSCHFQTNIYLSPRNAQGFKTHYDNHDVFVLQVSGSKEWTLYANGNGVELPLRGQGFQPNAHVPGPVTRELTVKAGDVLYVPRGVFHAARATDEVSLHITLGLMGKTWADVMIEAMSEACLASPAFRTHLPPGFANPGFDTRGAEATFRSLLDAFVSSARLGPILERFAEGFVTSRRPSFQGCLEELDCPLPVTLETRVVARPHLVYLLREAGETLVILFGPSEISLPAFTRPSVEAVLGGKALSVADIPGHLDDPGKIVLAQRLIREGMLVREGT